MKNSTFISILLIVAFALGVLNLCASIISPGDPDAWFSHLLGGALLSSVAWAARVHYGKEVGHRWEDVIAWLLPAHVWWEQLDGTGQPIRDVEYASVKPMFKTVRPGDTFTDTDQDMDTVRVCSVHAFNPFKGTGFLG